MEEENQEEQVSQNPGEASERTRVGFPQQQESRKFPTKLIVIIIILLLLAVGGWFFLIRPSSESLVDGEPTPTPFEVQESTPIPTPEEIEREGVKIQVLNGTGIAGQAAKVKDLLTELGLSKIETGNAEGAKATDTVVVFSPAVAGDLSEEIITLLKENFDNVSAQEADNSSEIDVLIATGKAKQ